MHMRVLPIVPFLMMVALASCGAAGLEARVYAGYMQTELSGTQALEPSSGGVSLNAIEIDVEEGLGLTDASASPYGRVELEAGPARFIFSAFRYSESGSGTLTADYGDISVGTAVNTDLDLTNLKAAVAFDLLDFGAVRLSPGIAVDLFDVDMTVNAPAAGQTEEIDALGAVPMLFAQAEVDLGPVAATVDGGWISVDLDEGSGDYFDIEGMLRAAPGGGFEVFGGYRWISIDVEGEDDGQKFATDLEFKGWFLGGGFRF